MTKENVNICPSQGCNFSTTDVYDRFCGDCGSELIGECPECGQKINYAGAFCTKCGVKTKQAKASVYETRSIPNL